MADQENVARSPLRCLSREEMIDYSSGLLSAKKRHELELHLTDCPFCSDAMDGMQEMDHLSSFIQADDAIKSRIKDLGEERKGSTVRVLFPWRMAAAFALLIASMATLWLIRPDGSESDMMGEMLEPNPTSSPAPLEKINRETATDPDAEESISTIPSQAKTVIVNSTEDLKEASPVVSEPSKEPTHSKYESGETSTTKAASDAPVAEDKQIADAQTGNAVESDMDAIQLTETIAVSSNKATKRRTSDAVSKKEAVPAASDEQKEKRTTTTNPIMDEAMALYYKGEYGQALLLFKKAPKTVASSYFAGICSFNLGDFDDSSRQFQSTINQVDAKSSINPIESNLQESSYWHLGLCLVKLGKTQEARNALQTVVRLNGEHKTSAEKLLKEL